MWYGVALFIHVLGAVILFSAVAIELLCGLNLLRARTIEHARMWSKAMAVIDRLFPLATVLLIGAGVYLALTAFSFREPFVVVGLVGLVTIAIQAQFVQTKLWKQVAEETAEAPDGPLPADLSARMMRPGVWSSIFADSAAAVGALVIMTNKPSWLWSIVIVVGCAAIGAALGPMVVRNRQTAPAMPPRVA